MSWLAGCDEWKPVARPVQPELILEGPIRLEHLLDVHGRYVLVSTLHEQEGEAPRRAYAIVDWKTAERCDLPTEMVRFVTPIFGPTDKRKQGPLFVLPIAVQDGDTQTLQFYDERCQKRGETDFGTVANTMQMVSLDEDGREVILYGNGAGVLATADPWNDQRVEIATGVRTFSFVQRSSMYSAPQMLWLIEDDGVLKQRTLDGNLLLSLGENVTSFVQVMFGELRVAFVAGGDVYEAVAPDFIPTRIAEAACRPFYRGNMLELQRPCDQQLVRINLQTGETIDFEKGVLESYTDNGYLFEISRDEKGDHQWVEPPGGARKEINVRFENRPLILTGGLLAGLKNLPIDCTLPDDARSTPDNPVARSRFFVIYDIATGVNLRALKGIADLFIFNDNRTSSYVWMVQHNMRSTEGAPEHRVGELALFSERDLRPDSLVWPACDPDEPTAFEPPAGVIETILDNVPERAPLGNTLTGARGFSVETAIPFREPLLILLSDAQPLSSNPRLSRGTLEARLLSGELGSTIAPDVSSYFLLTTPLPGVLYGVEEGDNPGLWFAAL